MEFMYICKFNNMQIMDNQNSINNTAPTAPGWIFLKWYLCRLLPTKHI